MTVTGSAPWRWLAIVLILLAAAVIGWVLLSKRIHHPTSRRQLLLRGGVPLLILAVLALLLADAASEGDGVTLYDRGVWQWFIDHRTPWLTTFFKVVTTVGSTVGMTVLALIAVILLGLRRRWSDVGLVATVAIGTGLLTTVAKHIVGRVRPPVEQRLVVELNQSFPSGHALSAAAILGVLAVVGWPLLRPGRRGWVVGTAALLAFLIGISRLYLGVHWATDVLGGWVTGTAWLLLCATVRLLIILHTGRPHDDRVATHAPALPGPDADPGPSADPTAVGRA